MSPDDRDHRDYLEDIVRAIDEVAEFTDGLSYKSFSQDRKTVNAVIRSLEVLGEAAKHITASMRQRAQAVPWKQMSGMRNKLSHEYFGVDLQIVWAVAQQELPPLRSDIERL